MRSRDKEREEMFRKVGQMKDLEREIVEAVKSQGFDLVSTQQKAGTLRKLIEEVDFKILNHQNMGVPDHLNDNTEWVHIRDNLYNNYLAASQYLERALGEENRIILPTIDLYKLKTANKTPTKPKSPSAQQDQPEGSVASVRSAIPTNAATFLQFIKAKQLDFQVAINEYEEARKKSEKRAYVQQLQKWLSRWSELEEAAVKMKTDFVDEDLARFKEAWTDFDDVVKQANEIVASFNTPLPSSDDESQKSSVFAWIVNQEQQRRHDDHKASKGPSSRQKRPLEHQSKKEISLRYTDDNAGKGLHNKPPRQSQSKERPRGKRASLSDSSDKERKKASKKLSKLTLSSKSKRQSSSSSSFWSSLSSSSLSSSSLPLLRSDLEAF